MLYPRYKACPFRIGLMLAVCSTIEPSVAHSETPQSLVVVSNTSVEEAVRQIGREHVRVEVLFNAETETASCDYTTCSKRARGLLEFHLLLLPSEPKSVREELWRERMSTANPQGKVHRLSRAHVGTEIEHRVQRAKAVHAVLTSMLPDQRKRLDANLRSEVQRLYLLTLPTQLAELTVHGQRSTASLHKNAVEVLP